MSEYRALYRKWRPVDFDDVCGQKAVTDILKFQVDQKKLSHAYLFCGSRGTGKTSCAKILAKAVNCLNPRGGNPCNECEACRSIDRGIATDVIEMDAASNNGVDDVRTLKDEISFTPASLRYRVYIIDEVHMMSQSAFNALLKTLEEPPTYVIFILATTEFHKLPTTIVSRCQRYDFKRMTGETIVERLMKIATEEHIDLQEDGARVIARSAQGGMRDAISLLELCAGSRQKIDETLVLDSIGTQSRDMAYQMIEATGNANYETVFRLVSDIVSSSMDIAVFFQSLLDAYRDIMVAKTYKDAKVYLDLTDSEYEKVMALATKMPMAKLFYHTTLLEEASSDIARAQLSRRAIAEVTLARMCDARLSTSPEALALRIEELEKQLSLFKLGGIPATPTKAPETAPVSVSENAPQAQEEPKEEAEEPIAVSAPKIVTEPYRRISRVIERVGEIRPSLPSQLQGAEAERTGNTFVLTVKPFFADRLSSNPQNLALLRGVIAELESINPEEVILKIEKATDTAKSARDDLTGLF